jgi:hypothetical protein
MAPFFQVAIVVPNLELAIDELSRSRGMSWTEPKDRELDGASYRTSWSHEGPPFIELIEGSPGTPWDAADGPRVDHLAWWSDNLDEEIDRHEANGVDVEFDHRLRGSPAAYLRAPHTGLRIQLVDKSYRSALENELGFKVSN